MLLRVDVIHGYHVLCLLDQPVLARPETNSRPAAVVRAFIVAGFGDERHRNLPHPAWRVLPTAYG
jgi:hypothetical protein